MKGIDLDHRPGLGSAPLVAALLLAAAPVHAEESAAKSLLDEARAAYAGRHDPAKAKLAFDLYEKALAAGAGYAAMWEGARCAADLGSSRMQRAKRGEKRAIFAKGVEFARLATKLRPSGAEGHLYLAITMGHHAESQSFLHQMSIASELRREAEQAVKLNPAAECGTPLRVLGMYYLRLPNAFGGSDREGLKLIERAAQICRDDVDTSMDYAEALAENGQRDKAIELLEWVLANPPSGAADKVGYRRTKAEAEKRLEALR